MRARVMQDDLTVQAIAGTYVVLLGLDLPKKVCKGLLGFGIHRTDHTENEANWMQGQKTFAETDPGRGAGAKFSTRQHPIQGFTWSDFSAKPGHDYTYRIVALKGTPSDLTEFASASVRVQTESPAEDGQDVYFNRGAAASQEYARRFHNKPPDEVGQAAFTWLSRGLFEAMKGFIDRAKKGEALRVAAYEFHYKPVLQALKEAHERGVDVKIVYDRRKDVPGEGNDKAIDAVGIRDLCTPRTASPSAISHNKFIVHLRNKKPVSVLTGGTNFSEGGIFGHSNALHIVGEPTVAVAYLRYWELLHGDPESKTLRPTLSDEFPVPENEPPEGTITIFSPRTSLQALEWYTARAAEAKDGLFATFAFGMHPDFQEVYRTSKARLRYALMEKATRPMPAGAAHDAEVQKIKDLRLMPENRFAIGAFLKMNEFDDWKWRVERLSGLNKNVQYVHTKYMLIDPLGPNPVVVAGSANFSAASTTSNDENMLIIRGNTRVADIYLGEFMRLYNHYAFREWASSQKGAAAMTATPQHLKTDDSWWRNYFGDTPQSHQRAYFVSGEVPPQAVGARRLPVKGEKPRAARKRPSTAPRADMRR